MYDNLECLQWSQAFRLAGFPGTDWASCAAIDECRRTGAFECARGIALQTNLQAQQRQRHAAAAAVFAALNPRGQSIPAEYALIFDIFGGNAAGWRQAETLHPLPAAFGADPVADLAADVTHALHMGHDLRVGSRCSGGG